MTISYNYDVSTASFTNFFKIAFRWKGSIYKNAKVGFTVWLICYFIISAIYRFLLNDIYKKKFNAIALYIDNNLNNIPLQFLLGFFVSVVIDRWKQTFYNMGFIETVALTISANLWGKDEESRLQRRTIIRYLVLHQILVYRDVSMSVRRRFPNLECLVTAGFALPNEIDYIQNVEFDYQRYWIPLNWTINILRKAEDQKKFDTSSFMNAIIAEICKFRTSISLLSIYDWVPVPLQYIQVATMAVNIYFVLCLISRQFLLLDDPKSDLFDTYFPGMTALQFIFVFGWLQVAMEVLNPLGEGDDDFECNFLIDKNLATGLAIADRSHDQPPMEEDLFNEEFRPMYTPESAVLHGHGLYGSVSTVNLALPDESVAMVELIPTDPTSDTNNSTIRSRVMSTINGKGRGLRNHQIRPVNLSATLPTNINLNPDRPSTREFETANGTIIGDTKV